MHSSHSRQPTHLTIFNHFLTQLPHVTIQPHSAVNFHDIKNLSNLYLTENDQEFISELQQMTITTVSQMVICTTVVLIQRSMETYGL
jgi:hypothetical protein